MYKEIPQGYTIRTALPEHIPFLAGIEQAAASLFPPGSIPDHIRSDAVPVPVFETALRQGHLWTALDSSDIPVGFALLRIVDGLAYLAEMDVRPEHTRQGLGRALLGETIRQARAEGYTELWLTTFTHVPWNAPSYARMGFIAIPEAELPPALVKILAMEHERGLRRRVAMCLDLG